VTPFETPELDPVRLCRVGAGVSGASSHLFRSAPGVSSKSPSVASASPSCLTALDHRDIGVARSVAFLLTGDSAAGGEGVDRGAEEVAV